MTPPQKLFDWLHRQKDSTASFVIERAAQRWILPYGRMLNLYIDSRQKNAQVELQLKGEKEPITILIQDYEIISEGDQSFVLVKKASASREWIHVLLNEVILNRRFPIPPQYEKMIRLVL